MSDDATLSAICTQCGAIPAPLAKWCARCGGQRIVRHAEIADLTIAHVDCDAFYAAIEKRDRPALADKPVIVGGGRRGVVTTACYVARTYGVRSAMPMFKALRACPGATVIKPDFDKYARASREIRRLMNDLTPAVEPVSIDEAFLDLSGCATVLGMTPGEALVELRKSVRRDVGVAISIGLSWNKFLAKLASDLEKPEGFTVIGRAETAERLRPFAISKMWGVGATTAAKMEKVGARTFGDLQDIDDDALMKKFGLSGDRFRRLAFGIDDRPVVARTKPKSVSSETTFERDIARRVELEGVLWRMCEKVSRRMKEKSLVGRAAVLKLKTARFKTLTRQTQIEPPSNLAHQLFAATRPLLAAAADGRTAYRLLGVGYCELEDAAQARQGDLFATGDLRASRREAAVDAIRERFGDDAISLGRGYKT